MTRSHAALRFLSALACVCILSSGCAREHPRKTVQDAALGRFAGPAENPLAGPHPMVELINPVSGEIWTSTHFPPADFAALEVSAWWRKNPEREPHHPGMTRKYLRSPLAEIDGEFEIAEMHGHPFVFTGKLEQRPETLDDDVLLQRIRVRKFEHVTLPAGATARFLVSPRGERWLRTSRALSREAPAGRIPEGFRFEERVLTAPETFEFSDAVDVVRDGVKDAYEATSSVNP